MNRSRGRPVSGSGLSKDEILSAALLLLDEGAGAGLTMRALASKLNVTPMSLYRHVADHAGLLRALAERVYGELLKDKAFFADHGLEVRRLLVCYYEVVARHPQLTLAIFSEPQAFSGVNQEITDHLTSLLKSLTPSPEIWTDILIDHAHGNGLARVSNSGTQEHVEILQARYLQSLDCLLSHMTGTPNSWWYEGISAISPTAID